MDLIEKTICQFAQDCIQKNLTLESAIEYITNHNLRLKQDSIFTKLFPIIFKIEYIEHMKNLKSCLNHDNVQIQIVCD